MPIPTPLLKCCARGLIRGAGWWVAGQIGAVLAGGVFEEIWEYWQSQTDSPARIQEIQTLAQANPTEVRAEVSRVVSEEAGGLPEDLRLQLEVYLSQIPATIRRTLRRPSDPSGTTIPPGLVLSKADDLLPFLPPRLPRFKPGDRPLAGVDWQLAELLGVGGFGEVWKATNPHFDGVPPVALKFCLDGAARDYLLRHEATVLNQVMRQGHHDGIIALRHTYLSADPPCLEYEYISGGDLAGLIQEWHRSGQPPHPEQAGKLMLQLAEVVGYMHRLDPPVVHRDLKPANILVQATEYGYGVKVADFGIGGLAVRQAIEQTRRGTRREVFLASSLRGAYTPLYASPQQMRGEAPDPRDDVYALGVIWYQLLTGDLMKGRPGGRSWQRRLLDRGVPAAWLDLLLACVEDEPEDRPADAGDLAGRLKGMLTTENAAPAAATSTSAQARIAESTGFTVILEAGFPPTNKISIIKAVREVLSIGLAEGKNLVEGAPQPIGGPMPEADARAIRLKLEAAGARVTIRTDAPFHFRSGEECHDLASLIACCERHPDDAEWHLTQGHFEPWLRTAGFEGVSDFARITRRSGKSPGDCLNDFLARLRQEIRLTKPDLGEQPQANSMYGEMLGFAIVGGIVGAILGVIGSSVEQAMPVNDSKGPLALFRAVAGATGKLGPAWAGLWGLILGSSVYYMERIRKK